MDRPTSAFAQHRLFQGLALLLGEAAGVEVQFSFFDELENDWLCRAVHCGYAVPETAWLPPGELLFQAGDGPGSGVAVLTLASCPPLAVMVQVSAGPPVAGLRQCFCLAFVFPPAMSLATARGVGFAYADVLAARLGHGIWPSAPRH